MTYADEPEKYYSEIESIFAPVVDFRYISRNVMGRHGKQATPDQRQEFTAVFKRGLLTTYVKGLSSFGEFELRVLPPKEDPAEKRKVMVAQEVQNADGVTKIYYTMGKNREGQWKLLNMTLNGVNLGKTFRDQFDQALRDNDGDMAKTVAGWGQS